MATARKKSAPKKAPAKAKPKPAAKARPVAKKAVPAKPKKPAAKPVKAARPAARPAAKAPAKAPAKVPAKAAPAKAAPAKAAKAAKAAPPAKAPAPVKVPPRIPKLVPATDAARAAAARAQRPARGRNASRGEVEVRPLGVLPPSAQARPRTAPVRPVGPSRPASTPAGTPKPQPSRKGDDRLTPDDLKYFEKRLLAERARIMGEMGHLESTVLKVNPRDAAGELSGYSYHMADAGTDSMEREKAFDIASKEGRLLLEIDDALRRLYGGTYGICEVSGKPISRARLEALPWARLSLDEQEKLEKEQRAGRAPAPSAE